MNIRKKYRIKDDEYYNCVKELLESKVVQQMEKYLQHGKTTTLKHCIDVSYKSYKVAKILKLNYRAAARAALLHDLFLYDWHEFRMKKKLFENHGYTHPRIALENAVKYFKLTDLERDIILKHMWPLTLRQLPKYKETLLVSMIDKYSSTKEIAKPILRTLKR